MDVVLVRKIYLFKRQCPRATKTTGFVLIKCNPKREREKKNEKKIG
jgi:hypothetical protein